MRTYSTFTPEGATVINLNVDYVRHGAREQVPGGAAQRRAS